MCLYAYMYIYQRSQQAEAGSGPTCGGASTGIETDR